MHTLLSFVFLSHSVSIVILFTFKPDRDMRGEGDMEGGGERERGGELFRRPL